MKNARLKGLLQAFIDADVRFVVIGGVSAVLQGVPVTTFDLDLVLDQEESNLDRAFAVLAGLDPCYRDHLPKKLIPQRSDLDSASAAILMTSLGPMDLLGQVATGWPYEELMTRSHKVRIAEGLEVFLLDLSALIEIKECVGGEKDRAALPIYKRTLQERDGAE